MTIPTDILFEADVRVEKIIYIPSISVTEDSFFDDFEEDFVEWIDACPDVIAALPKLDGLVDADEIAQALMGTSGFLIYCTTPVRRYSGSSFYSGWGTLYTSWLYAPSEAAIAEKAAEWAEGRHVHDEQRAAT